jgi:hypothetical protein
MNCSYLLDLTDTHVLDAHCKVRVGGEQEEGKEQG